MATPHSPHNHSDEQRRQPPSAHLHGVAHLTVALEGDSLLIRLESPAADIVGFEGKANSAAQIEAVLEATQRLKSSNLFLFSGSDCQLQQVSVDASSLSKQDNQHKSDASHTGHGSHSEISADYSYACSKGGKLAAISVKLISRFPSIKTLEVVWLTERRQGAIELTEKSGLIRIR